MEYPFLHGNHFDDEDVEDDGHDGGVGDYND